MLTDKQAESALAFFSLSQRHLEPSCSEHVFSCLQAVAGIRNVSSEPPAAIISLLKILSSFSRNLSLSAVICYKPRDSPPAVAVFAPCRIALRNKSMKFKRPPTVVGKVGGGGAATFRSVIPAEPHQLRRLQGRFCNKSQLMKIRVKVLLEWLHLLQIPH